MPVFSKVDDATELPDVVERAITSKQFMTFADHVSDLCMSNQLTDTSLMKVNAKGQKVPNANQGNALRYGRWDGDEKNVGDFFAEINMCDIVESVLKPMTKGPATSGRFPLGCSYVEIVCTQPQSPEIFVSHYWGQPFSILVSSLQGYAKRQARIELRLWICSLAQRQWCLEQELGTNSDAFPFARVINHPSTQSTVLFTSADCGALRRLWCLFEVSKAVNKRRHNFDIVIGSAGTSDVRILCTAEVENPDSKLIEDATWDKLLDIQVESAGSSKFADKHLLMSQIQVTGAHAFNAAIKKRIAQRALGAQVSRGDIETVKDMLALRIDVNSYDAKSNEGSPLHMAVANSNVAMVELLLKSKADVNDQRNPLRQSPLHKAKDSSIMKVLLDRGADAERMDANGNLPQKHSEPSPEESQSPVSPAGNQETLPVALASAEKDKEAQPEDAGVIYDELLSLLMTEKPISTKVDWKFSGKIKLPRQAVSAAA
jgi:hypothetical protein